MMEKLTSAKPASRAELPDINTGHWLEYVLYVGLILIVLLSVSFDAIEVFELL